MGEKEDSKERFLAKLANVGRVFDSKSELNTKELAMQGITGFAYGALQQRSTVFKALPNVIKSDVGNDFSMGVLSGLMAVKGPKSLRPHAARVLMTSVAALSYNAGAKSTQLDGVIGSINNAIQAKDKQGNIVQPDAVNVATATGTTSESIEKLKVKPKP